jgi:AcrR family transcriptional regulator
MVGKKPAASQGAEPPGTRERILAAAARVLSVKGYSGARLSDIAETAELRAPAIYYYFTSREHLVAEVMAEGQRIVLECVEQALAGLPAASGPLDRIDRAVAAHLEVELRQSDFATAVIRNSGQLPDDAQRLVDATGRKYFELWRQLLADAADAGEIDQGLDLRVARMLVLGALNWTAEWWDPGRGTLDTLVATAQRMVRSALTGPRTT